MGFPSNEWSQGVSLQPPLCVSHAVRHIGRTPGSTLVGTDHASGSLDDATHARLEPGRVRGVSLYGVAGARP